MTNFILQPLAEAELKQLDEFLQTRHNAADCDNDEHEHNEDSDSGVLNISELDGMLTALVSAPTLVKPADWVPAVWGDDEPEWRDEKEFDAIVHLMQRHMNTLAATLSEAPNDYEPLFLFEEDNGETFTIVDDWCEGYLRGVKLAAAVWNAGKPTINKLLTPIRAFSSETNWRGHDLPEAESDKLSDAIVVSVREIARFWQERKLSAHS